MNNPAIKLNHEELQARYDLLCRASQSSLELQHDRLQLGKELDKLQHMITQELPELARRGSPDNFADILRALTLELEHFREFCEFPDLAQKVVVGFGGAFSAGKSTLINTILGEKRLVAEVDPTTSLPTYLLYGQQERITAINLFRKLVQLNQDEFLSLTHEEQKKYGSQITGLLRSAFVSDPKFQWHNLALLDTPGYSKPDSEGWSDRTDEQVARSQLNSTQFIVWVVSAAQGTISEDDLRFLQSLNADIPKLIVVSRADSKTPEDIQKITALIRQTVSERAINIVDVLAMSRKKKDYPIEPITAYFEQWNQAPRTLNFTQSFKREFVAYARFIEAAQRQATTKLDYLNKLLVLSDDEKLLNAAQALQYIEKSDANEWQIIGDELNKLEQQFFQELNQIAERLGLDQQLTDPHTVVSNPTCPPETLATYASTIKDHDLLGLIYKHPNCPEYVLENLLQQPPASIDKSMLITVLTHQNLPNLPIPIKAHLKMLNTSDKYQLASSYTLPEMIQDILVSDENPTVLYTLACKTNTKTNIQERLADSALNNTYLAYTLIENPDLCLNAQLTLTMHRNDNIKIKLAEQSMLEDVQRVLSNDENSHIRNTLFKNKSLHHSIKKELLSPLSHFRTEQEQKHLSLIASGDTWEKASLANDWWISEKVQLKLANDHEEDVKSNLARNPTITPKTQLRLAENLEENTLYNFIRSNLSDNKELCDEALYVLLKNESIYFDRNLFDGHISISEKIQLQLSQEGFILTGALSEYPNLTESTQLTLMESFFNTSDLIKNKNLTEKVQLLLIETCSDDELCDLASNEYLSDAAYLKLSHLESEKIATHILRNPAINNDIKSFVLNKQQNLPNLYWRLTNNQTAPEFTHEYIRFIVDNNGNANTLEFAYEDILSSDIYFLKEIFAQKAKLTEAIQLQIYQNEDLSGLHASLASNIHISEHVQNLIAKDTADYVRACLAENPSINTTTQYLLARDNIDYVRTGLAKNPNIKTEIQELLAKDAEKRVRDTLAKNHAIKHTIQDLLAIDTIDYVRVSLAKNKNITKSTYEQLAKDSDNSVRYNLTSNPNISTYAQELLAKDQSDYIRTNLARNPNLSENIQLILARDEDQSVRLALYQNPQCTLAAREIIMAS